jgi:predicted DNA-binding transcriptional regulator YafY
MRPDVRCRRLLTRLTTGRVRIGDAAAELGVSVRTVHRDIGRLRRDGYRIASAPGPRGGVWLARDSRPAPLSLEVDTVRQLVVHLVGTGAADRAEPLLEGLPPQVQQRLRALMRAIEPASCVEPLDDAVLRCVESAFDDRWPLGVTDPRPGRRYHTVAFPLALFIDEGQWTLRGVRRGERRAETFGLADPTRIKRHVCPWAAPRGVSRRYRMRRPDDPPARDWKRPIHGTLPPWALERVGR